jgi:hypothetical protein
MKFQIDTSAKIVKVEEKFKLKELVKIMKSMFPDDWEEYNIDTHSIISWNWPVTNCGTCWYKRNYHYDCFPYRINDPYIYCGTGKISESFSLTNLQSELTDNHINLVDQKGTILSYNTSDTPHIINVETKD